MATPPAFRFLIDPLASPDLGDRCRAVGIPVPVTPDSGDGGILVSDRFDAIVTGFRSPYLGFILLDDGPIPADPLPSIPFDIIISLTTEAAWRSDVTLVVARLLAERFGGLPAAELEICLGEAIANAVVHGNLGLDGRAWRAAKRTGTLAWLIKARLADSRYGNRRLEITGLRVEDGVKFTVCDQGSGWTPGTTDEAGDGFGRRLLAKLAADVRYGEDGTRVTFTLGHRATAIEPVSSGRSGGGS